MRPVHWEMEWDITWWDKKIEEMFFAAHSAIFWLPPWLRSIQVGKWIL